MIFQWHCRSENKLTIQYPNLFLKIHQVAKNQTANQALKCSNLHFKTLARVLFLGRRCSGIIRLIMRIWWLLLIEGSSNVRWECQLRQNRNHSCIRLHNTIQERQTNHLRVCKLPTSENITLMPPLTPRATMKQILISNEPTQL